MEKKNKEQQETKTKIKSSKELEKEVEITMDEINAEAAQEAGEDISHEEIKAALDILNPDEGSMESRG